MSMLLNFFGITPLSVYLLMILTVVTPNYDEKGSLTLTTSVVKLFGIIYTTVGIIPYDLNPVDTISVVSYIKKVS